MAYDPNSRDKFVTQQEAKARFLAWLDSRRDFDSYFRSGFKGHDQTAGHFQRGGLYVYAARPGIGKTAMLLALARHQALMGVSTYFFSLEMSIEQMWLRLACIHRKDLSLWHLLNDPHSDSELELLADLATNELIKFSPLFCEDGEFKGLERTARGNINPGSRSMLFLDYLGLLSMQGYNAVERYQLISEVSRRLKQLARELKIPIACAVQLNRQIEGRKQKGPILSDLSDSGDIEKNADAVFMLTRENKDCLDVHICKNRNGPTGSYNLAFDGPRVAVEEWD